MKDRNFSDRIYSRCSGRARISATPERDGLVERDGLFWLEDLPLSAGDNQLPLVARNARFATTTMLTVTKSPVHITVYGHDPTAFTNFFVDVLGKISDPSYTVWVNGAKATMSGGSWIAHGARVNQGGTATLHVRAIPNSDHNGNGTAAAAHAAGGDCLNNVDSCDPNSDGAVDENIDAEVPAFIPFKEYHGGYDAPAQYTQGQTACDSIGSLTSGHWQVVMRNHYHLLLETPEANLVARPPARRCTRITRPRMGRWNVPFRCVSRAPAGVHDGFGDHVPGAAQACPRLISGNPSGWFTNAPGQI